MNLLNSLIAKLKEHSKTMILEAAAITAYQESHTSPTIEFPVGDDAKEFCNITYILVLWWINEERYYKKLTPFLFHQQKVVDDFRSRIWEYYKELTEYKKTQLKQKRYDSLIYSTKYSQQKQDMMVWTIALG